MKSRRTALLSATVLTAAFVAVVWVFAPFTDSLEQQRSDHAAFVNELVEKMAEYEDKPGPDGLDGPGEAAQFEFIRTMDPATRTIPTERLWRANEIGTQQLRGGALMPSVTTAWSERGPTNVGGRTRAVMWDPNVPNQVWAGGVAGGLWRTDDITTDGTPWVSVDDFWANLAVTAIAYDPSNTQVYYAATGEGFYNFDAVQGGGIFKSTDAGATWNRLPSTDPAANIAFRYVNDLVVAANGDVLAATRNGGVQRSLDGGMTWTTILTTGLFGAGTDRSADLEIAADGSIYATLGVFTFGGIWKSTNNGTTWTQQTLPFPASGNATVSNNYQRIEVCTAPSDANTVYAFTQRANGTGALQVNHGFKTTNGGATWASTSLPSFGVSNAQAWYDLICAVDPNNTNVVWLGVVDIYRTTSGGTGWTEVGNFGGILDEDGLHVDHHAIAYRPGSSAEVVFGNDGGVNYSANANTAGFPSYVNRNDGYNVTQYYGGDLSPTAGSNVLIGGTQDNATHRLNDAAITSATAPAPLNCCDGGFAFIDDDDANFAVGTIQLGAAARSFDGGQTYGGNAEGVDIFLGQNSALFIAALAFDSRENLMYTTWQGNATNSLIRVSNVKTPGVNPTLNGLSIPGVTSPVSAIGVSPYSTPGTSTVVLGTSAGRVIKVVGAQPGGARGTTNITGSINPGYISSVEFGASEDQILVTVSNYGVNSVYETTDGGTTWVSKDSPSLPDVPVRWALYDPLDLNSVILATESGIWETEDFSSAAPTWTRAPGFPTTRVDQLQVRASDNTIVALTHGRGMWTASFGTEPPVAVTFQVDGSLLGLGPNEVLALRGDTAPLSFEQSFPLADDDGDGIWTGTVNFSDALAGSNLEYKFVRHSDTQGDLSAADLDAIGGFEGDVGPGAFGNRVLEIPAEDTVLPVVFFDNQEPVVCDGLPRIASQVLDASANTVTVTFEDGDGLAEIDFTLLNNLFVSDSDGFASTNGATFTPPGMAPETAVFVVEQVDTQIPEGSFWVNITDGCAAGPEVYFADPILRMGADAAVPAEFGLAAAYPNPFGGAATRTMIPVDVAEASEVRVVVYDVLGRSVAVLMDGPMQPGRYEAVLAAANLAPGTYVVRMTATGPTAGGFSQTQRLTLVR